MCKSIYILHSDGLGVWIPECPYCDQFSKLFTVSIRRKFVIILSLKIPPHLKCVATLPC